MVWLNNYELQDQLGLVDYLLSYIWKVLCFLFAFSTLYLMVLKKLLDLEKLTAKRDVLSPNCKM